VFSWHVFLFWGVRATEKTLIKRGKGGKGSLRARGGLGSEIITNQTPKRTIRGKNKKGEAKMTKGGYAL